MSKRRLLDSWKINRLSDILELSFGFSCWKMSDDFERPERSRYMVYIYSRRLFHSDHIWTMYLQIIMVKASWPFSTGYRDWYCLNEAHVCYRESYVRFAKSLNESSFWFSKSNNSCIPCRSRTIVYNKILIDYNSTSIEIVHMHV